MRTLASHLVHERGLRALAAVSSVGVGVGVGGVGANQVAPGSGVSNVSVGPGPEEARLHRELDMSIHLLQQQVGVVCVLCVCCAVHLHECACGAWGVLLSCQRCADAKVRCHVAQLADAMADQATAQWQLDAHCANPEFFEQQLATGQVLVRW